MIDLPLAPQGSWFQFSTELEGVTFGFEFRWNERLQLWFCSLRDGEGNAIVSGRALVLGPLFRKFRARPGVPQAGDVYAIDTNGTNIDAGFDDLGKRVVLTFATDAELGI